MLARTLSRQGHDGGKRRWRTALIALATLGALTVAYLLLPAPGPRVRPATLTDDELRQVVQSLRLPKSDVLNRRARSRGALGRALFFDKNLSANGQVACASCHDPKHDFSDGRELAVGIGPFPANTPTLINAGLGIWFQADGRADSLAAAALLPLEDPRISGVSRTFVARLLKESHAKAYEDAFGPWPEALRKAALPVEALPPQPPPKIPLELSAYALSTLGSFPLLSDTLKAAQAARLAPAMELARRALSQPQLPAEWYAAWQRLGPTEQRAVDEVFANAGKAFAAYLQNLVAAESPFDRFAARLADGRPLHDALDTEFAERELNGLKLFAGAAGCVGCHTGPGFSDQSFHNIGLPQRGEQVAFGRAAGERWAEASPFRCAGEWLVPEDVGAWPVTCERPAAKDLDQVALVGAVKTPTLRNVTETAPYMHDGRMKTLGDVIDYYSDLPEVKPALGHRDVALKRLDLTAEERAALLSFLGAIKSPVLDVLAKAMEVGTSDAETTKKR